MKYAIAFLLILIACLPARAHRHHHHARIHHHVTRYHAVKHHRRHYGRTSSIVTVITDAGPITVATHMAPRFVGFIHDLIARIGYRPHSIGCFARDGHIRNSMHYSGEACDFDQRARNATAGPMYHISELAAQWGLTDGCHFHDCGHISNGR